jgi:uncharacterized protein YdaU (DUF1376 family)
MMHYYQFHIGDYRAATSHLSNEEDLAYRRLLDMYYDTEAPIPTDIDWVCRRLRLGSEVVTSVLKDMFELIENGYVNRRADSEIKAYHAYKLKQQTNGKRGGRPKKTQAKPTANPEETQHEPKKSLTTNQEPITIVEAKPKQSRGTRLPADWKPSEEQIAFCKTERPDLHPMATGDRFRDFWIAQAGSKGVKLDWDATWRNWVRNEKAGGNKPQQDKPGFFMGRKLSGVNHG